MDRRARALGVALALGASACGGGKEAPPVEAPRPSGFPQPGHLVPLLTLNNPHLVPTTELIARTGNEQEKATAGRHLIGLAEAVASDAWREAQRPVVWRMAPRRGAAPTEGEIRGLLDDWQERHQVRVYDAMKVIGGAAVLEHCRRVVDGEDHKKTEQRLAFSVLAAHGRAKSEPANPWGMPGGPGAQHLGWGQPPGTTFPGAATDPGEGGVRAAAPPQVTGGTIENIEMVATALQPYFVICYKRALAEHGRFGAWITLDARVASNGHVASVDGRGDDGVPMSMMSCLKGVVQQALFTPPRGGDPIVSLSWSFLPPAVEP